MTETQIPPAPPVEAPKPKRKPTRRWLAYVAIGVASLLLGVIIGAASGSDTDSTDQADQIDVLNAEIDDLDAEIDDLNADLEQVTAERDELQAAAEAATVEPSTPEQSTTTAPEAPAAGQPGTYTAGNYTFSDVQVFDDGVGDFALRARVTNNGDTVESASWTATLFNAGTTVAVLNSSSPTPFAAGQTATVEFFGIDDYGSWDKVEFQVDYEF
jgi:outer membrane murein-binding lipoprotein Lpp